MFVEYILWPFHPKVCVWKAGPEPSFQELFNSLFVGTTQNIFCLFKCKRLFNSEWFKKACANMFDYVEFIPIPSPSAEPEAAQENACVAVFQAIIGLFSEACRWLWKLTIWYWLPAQIHIRQGLSWNGKCNGEWNPLPKVVWHWAHWSRVYLCGKSQLL